MREEDIIKKIKDSADHATIPESLEPEQMMKRLKELDNHEELDSKTDSRQEKRSSRRYWQYGTAAAAALLAVTLISVNQGKFSEMPSDSGQIIHEAAGMEEEAIQEITGLPEAEGEPEHDTAPAAADSAEADDYRAGSYDEVYDRFQELRKEEEARYGNENGAAWWNILGGMTDEAEAVEAEEALPQAEADGAAAGGAAAQAPESGSVQNSDTAENAKQADTKSYSDTNVQVEGVDEGDVVKTDGTYIYAASANMGTIRIIRPDGTDMKMAGVIPDTSTVEHSKRIEEFYLNGDYLTVIRSYYETTEDTVGPVRGGVYEDAYCYGYMPGKSMTVIETYDLTRRENPKLTGSVTQDGYYRNSRRSGDYVYVFTGYDTDINAERKELEKYIPQVNGNIIPADCIYIPENLDAYSYLVISSIDMRAPGVPVQTKAVAASGQQYYVSSENIYIASCKYDFRANQYDYTELMKFSYRDGRIGFASHGNVNGYLNNQFSMDEYQGYLRLVSTLSRSNGKTTNSLYILDEKLNKVGAIEDLAPDEQIYSARFMGEIGYFVTFRNMDPLFSVDLSDPENPKVLGELKITGFSEYLHPYSDGLLLGIGREIDPKTTNFEGLKLSMFDTTDPKHVKEVQKVVEADYEYSPAWYDHKSVLISPSRNLIGFTVESYNYDKREWGVEYTVYAYDKEKGFEQKLSADLDTYGDYYMVRGLYINDWLYVVENNQINAYSLNDFKHGGELKY